MQPLSRAAGYAAVFAVVLWFGLALLPAGILFHVDTVRDLFLARNCAASDACLSLGPRSSAFFYHGFLWHRFLALFLSAGVPLDVLPVFLAVLHALSAALLYAAVERGAGRLTGLVAAALYCLAGFDRSLADPIWTPTSIPIFANAFAAAAALALLSDGARRTGWAAAAAAALVLALGTQVHNELFLLLPGVLAFLFIGRRSGWVRPAALSAALLACLALAWAVFSRDSLLANWRLLWDFPAQAWGAARPHRVTAAEALLFAGFAGAWAAALLLRPWRPGREPELFFTLASGSYLLGFLPVFFTHESSLRYYAPVVPLLGLLWARVLGPALERFRRSSTLLLGLLALLAANRLHDLGRAAAPGLGSPLRLGEIQALAGAFAEQGCDASAMYRQSSGGQRAYLDFLSGLWLHAPCLRDEAVLGGGPPARERFAVVAVEPGRPLPSAARGLDLRRVAGSGRDFFIIRYEPWLALDEFREVRGGRAGPARRFGVKNRGFGRLCWDPETLSFGVRGMVSRDTATLRLRLRVPAGSGERTLFLPELDAYGWPRPGCAARFERLSGISAATEEGGRVLRLRGARASRAGTVDVSWPVSAPECFPDPYVRYPMPVLELPSGLFRELRGELERP